MDITEYKLIKIKYNHSLKDFKELITEIMPDDYNYISNLKNDTISHSYYKKGGIVDWFWIKSDIYIKLIDILELYFNITVINHTETYFKIPEKIADIKSIIDKWMIDNISPDDVLDRISLVGIDKISKIEKTILNNSVN